MSELTTNADEALAGIPLDKHGYLADLHCWTEALALAFARQEGINMTPAHWEVVWFVRDFYQEYNTSPAIRILVKAMAEKLGPEKGNSKYLFMLFPEGQRSKQPGSRAYLNLPSVFDAWLATTSPASRDFYRP